MTGKTNLNTLASRVEDASGPDRELDIEIIRAVHPGAELLPASRFYSDMFAFAGGHFRLSDFRYTASLDAAVSLLPADWFLNGLFDTDESRAHCQVIRTNVGVANGSAATPALALCAASLRAISSMEKE